MKKSYQKLLESVRATVLAPSEFGITPEEVKQVIIHILSPYFENQEILIENAIPILAPEAVNISRINKDEWADRMLTNILGDYRRATQKDKTASFIGFANLYSRVLQSNSEYISLINLSTNLDELSLEDFKFEAFRGIGTLIEANIQPYLKGLLLQIRIRRGNSNPDNGLETMKLGDVINELIQVSDYKELFAPPPWGIRLGQWRNMAQHHNTRVENDLIIGTYDVGNISKEIVLTREEIVSALKRITSILSILKGANSVYFIDHENEIRTYITQPAGVIRTDAKIFSLASSLATQGFELVDISIDGNSVIAILRDVTETPQNATKSEYIQKRIIHSSQFVYEIWAYFSAEEITISHFDKNDKLRCLITGNGSDCEAVNNGEILFEDLAGKVNFKF